MIMKMLLSIDKSKAFSLKITKKTKKKQTNKNKQTNLQKSIGVADPIRLVLLFTGVIARSVNQP